MRVIVNLRVHEWEVNYPLVVQSHGGNEKFFRVALSRSIRVNVARDAGFRGSSIRVWHGERNAGKLIGADYPHVKHRKCKAPRLSVFSFQLHHGVAATKSTLAGGFFFFGGVAGEETLDEVSVGFAGAKFGVSENFAV